jgi:hypothetical protein
VCKGTGRREGSDKINGLIVRALLQFVEELSLNCGLCAAHHEGTRRGRGKGRSALGERAEEEGRTNPIRPEQVPSTSAWSFCLRYSVREEPK